MHKITRILFISLGMLLLCLSSAARSQTAPAGTSTQPMAPAAATAMPSSPAASASAAAPAPAATAKVGQAQFTTGVDNREPADDISNLDNSHDKVFFFSVLKDASGQTITHRWQYNGNTMAEVKFEPKADHWRVWSSKTLMPDQTGTWTVQVLDSSGNVLVSKSFDFTQAPMPESKATHKPPAMQSAPAAAPAATTHAAPPPTL
jgi:hypothetical protein